MHVQHGQAAFDSGLLKPALSDLIAPPQGLDRAAVPLEPASKAAAAFVNFTPVLLKVPQPRREKSDIEQPRPGVAGFWLICLRFVACACPAHSTDSDSAASYPS
jgi:hypothetical protein